MHTIQRKFKQKNLMDFLNPIFTRVSYFSSLILSFSLCLLLSICIWLLSLFLKEDGLTVMCFFLQVSWDLLTSQMMYIYLKWGNTISSFMLFYLIYSQSSVSFNNHFPFSFIDMDSTLFLLITPSLFFSSRDPFCLASPIHFSFSPWFLDSLKI